jgi:hypothetical protein
MEIFTPLGMSRKQAKGGQSVGIREGAPRLHHIATLFLIQCLYWEQSGFIIQKARKTGTFRASLLFLRPLPICNTLQKVV